MAPYWADEANVTAKVDGRTITATNVMRFAAFGSGWVDRFWALNQPAPHYPDPPTGAGIVRATLKGIRRTLGTAAAFDSYGFFPALPGHLLYKTFLVALVVDSFEEFGPIDPGELVRPKAFSKCLQVSGKLPLAQEFAFAFELGSPR